MPCGIDKQTLGCLAMHIQFSDNQRERQRVQQWLSLLRLQTQQSSLEEAIAAAAAAIVLLLCTSEDSDPDANPG